MTGAAAGVWLAHVLAVHLHVPEPVRFELRAAVPGFEARHDAVIDWDNDGWVVRYDPDLFAATTDRRARFVLAHEACHAVYNHTPAVWAEYDQARRLDEHARVDECAKRVVLHHAFGVGHE